MALCSAARFHTLLKAIDMPLAEPDVRREIHSRVIDMRAFARRDGLYDVEAHLVDRKPFDFKRLSSPVPLPAGEPVHDLWVRMTVDENYVVRALVASSDATPWGALCREAESTLSVLVGETIARGWSKKVKELLRGSASCTHLMEVLLPMATTAFQGILAMHPERLRDADSAAVAGLVDSCYAYGRERPVVQRLWPQHYRKPD
ncbi:DUF2889 domain-containing protein [Variovorax sp. Sphag1AA]|uniref:DUF2889 domain-containing protein n=1 Tax=Variovorax sp. Sphag1AA TaxID=2587027 RepID=UPI0016163210|nr:DUF2889 domain-containing protein [Variovorax sp. Sphag1AA]MBB3181139.1 hypothetical protein [Variovorax sp. Sphag1AA]